ncbi:hypothetical protein BaRGS_00028544, partial [Batillaria attramentaria]
MEGLKLGDLEQQYYAELFQTCDVEGTGKITGMKASELFLASGLNQDALKQIWELCGAKRLGQFGRSQFYIALKLIAVAQAGLPIKLETLNAGKDIPLPKFSAKSNDQGKDKRVACPLPLLENSPTAAVYQDSIGVLCLMEQPHFNSLHN